MSEVLIHRCTLHVVRRGGWSWGPDPKRMLENVVRSFPAMLARKLEELFPEEVEREFASPIRIRIPIRLRDLVPESTLLTQTNNSEASRGLSSLEEKLDAALRRTFCPAPLAAESPPQFRFATSIPDSTEKVTDEPSTTTVGAVPRALMRWHRAGVLARRLASLDSDEIERWQRAVWPQADASEESMLRSVWSLEQQAIDLARLHEKSFSRSDRGDRQRLRLFVATALAAQIHTSIENPKVLSAVNKALPLNEFAETTLSGFARTPERDPEDEILDRHTRAPILTTVSPWETHVDCALPFLLLNPLSRLGYFDALAAVLEAAELTRDAPLFATALAYKVLDSPERGWRRNRSSVMAASAFAETQEPVPNEALVQFSRQMAPHTAPLDLILTESLIQGHTSGDPVLLRRADSENAPGFLLLETSGCFPIAWRENPREFLPLLAKLGDSIVLVSREAAGPRLLKELDTAGFPFICDVPPTRGEAWQRIQQGPVQLGWTNHANHESIPVLDAARRFSASSQDAAALWETLGIARPGIVRGTLPQLERSLTLAAAVATGIIAWQLWRSRGRTTPQMVVERFCDLDGRVRFNPSSIIVELPLGRRHQELLQGGLLSPVRDVPWFGNRQVELGGG